MTITPKQAMELREEDRAEIRELERKIDKALKIRFEEPRDRVCIDIGNASRKVLNEIRKAYNEAGWNVRYQSDQRDGDYLEFTARKNYQEGQR